MDGQPRNVPDAIDELAGKRLGDLVFHDLAGWLMMPLALGMLALELAVLSWLLVEVPEEEPVPVDFVARAKADLLHAR